nr:immunoglobulin heavy chain junction region [Macaca mulatta]MOX92793.1 immunoglobulin heavy chain junction region [Macaca mulatta]MOX94918.1 immunoglobulin heavy chain junction region [Macaca mulatta]MOX95301.1 immunoglobulin heavy chain junction region [Macaca mulatta]MOX95399.1 immunoglobulin heavy chain junction region [Macaca mulatta]
CARYGGAGTDWYFDVW